MSNPYEARSGATVEVRLVSELSDADMAERIERTAGEGAFIVSMLGSPEGSVIARDARAAFATLKTACDLLDGSTTMVGMSPAATLKFKEHTALVSALSPAGQDEYARIHAALAAEAAVNWRRALGREWLA